MLRTQRKKLPRKRRKKSDHRFISNSMLEVALHALCSIPLVFISEYALSTTVSSFHTLSFTLLSILVSPHDNVDHFYLQLTRNTRNIVDYGPTISRLNARSLEEYNIIEYINSICQGPRKQYARRQPTLAALVPAVPHWPTLPKKPGPPRVTNILPASRQARPPR